MDKPKLNSDITTYDFENSELEEAVGKLSDDEGRIVILQLMGFTLREIGDLCGGVTQSALSQRMQTIRKQLFLIMK